MIQYTFEPLQRPAVSDPSLKQIHPILLDILYRRGYTTEESMKAFLFPNYNDAIRPFDCKDANAAIQVLSRAISEKSPIVVYRDYDVDGISAGAVALECLSKLGATVHQYANEREIDGYGICKNGIRNILKRWPETRVLLTVDNGIVATEAVEYANSLGLTVVITDHHEPGPDLPKAAAVVDLKRKDETYPFRELCGCGVVFRLMLDLYRYLKKDPTPVLNMIDIVALATVADVVPILDENRALVHKGLERMESGERVFFRVAARVFNVTDITAHYTVAFLFVPTLNTLSRMGHDTDAAVDALLSNDETRVTQLVQQFKDLNEARKEETDRQLKIALQKIGAATEPAIVIQDEEFTEGIVGILAGRLKSKFHRPVIVFAKAKNGTIKGSGRSIDQFPLHENLRELEAYIVGFGGHAKAAGLTIEASKLEIFRDAFLKLAGQKLTPDDFIEKVPLAAVLDESELSEQLVRELRMLEPYGDGFPEPLFGLRADCKEVRFMGSESQHVKILTNHGTSVIAWNKGAQLRSMKGCPSKFVGKPGLNVWNGNVSVQFVCAD